MSSRSSSRSRLAAMLAAGVAMAFAFGAALVTSVISAAPASAHATLVKLTPAANAQLTAPPTQVVVEFNETVGSTFATVVVTNAAGVSVSSGQPTVLGGKLTQALRPDLASGAYRIAFRVVSDDGHPVTGESKFTLALAPGSGPRTTAGAPSATPNGPVAATPSVDSQEGFLTRFFVPIAGAFGLLVLGAGLLLWERQRR